MTQGPVTLFSDRHFAGSSVPLDEGDTRFPADFNDTASSIHVAPGYGAVLYEYANEYGGYGAWVDLLEDCPDLSVYGFDKKTSYVHVFRTERDGFVWARGAMRDGQFIPGHWERKRASGGSDLNSTVAVVAPPLPARTTPLPAGEGVVVRDHRGEPQQDPPGTARFATFTMDSFGISNTRSLHNDTDFVYLSATVGANPPVFAKKSVGDVNNGTHSVGLSIEVDIPDDDTIVVFNYLIMNSGHGGDDTRAKAAQAALSTVAEEIIKHKAITAGAIAVGAILVPLFVSALAAIAGVLAVVEVGLLLFADCDGLVAAGALPFTGSDLIRRTSSGQKISENADHPGIDSPAGCGSNSHYTTACTITTAPSIQTVLDLRGAWASGGVAGPFVSVTGNSISIDMSASHRPAASGRVLDSTHISVNFPDDKTYTGRPTGPQCHQVVEQLELDESPGDPDRDRLERSLGERWRSGSRHHGAWQFHFDRHVGAEASDGGWDGRQRFGYLGDLSRRQDLFGRSATTRGDPLVEQLDLDQVRHVGDQASVRAGDGEPV